MKIVHLNLIKPRVYRAGVFSRFDDQIKAARGLGLDLDYYILNYFIERHEPNSHYIKICKAEPTLIDHVKNNILKYQTISKYVDLDSYDRILFRYALAIDPFGVPFFKKHRGKIITIHHTNEVEELKSFRSPLFKIASLVEKFNSPVLLRHAAGIIGVTDEIRNNELAKLSVPKPSMTIANGINVENTPFTGFKPFNGTSLTVVFVASAFFPWHGLERLLSSLKSYTGPVPIKAFLIGRIISVEQEKLLKSFCNPKVEMVFVGEKTGRELDFYYKNSNCAISSLALYLDKLTQGCVLKTREYMAKGIPFIYAYDDVDIQSKNDFCLCFPNDNSIIDFSAVLEFARKVSAIKNVSKAMRDFALQTMDWKIKVKKMYEFAKSV